MEKIAINGKKESEKNGFKIEEKIVPKQEPISLSQLKKQDKEIIKTENILPSKEASDEKKSSLKDVLSRINVQNKITEIKKDEPIVAKEEAPIPKIVEQKQEQEKEEIKAPKIEEKIEPIKIVEEVPIIKNEEPKKEEDKNSSWQKRKVKKEVPEDVLRKVLE